jgi:hypothetical protein
VMLHHFLEHHDESFTDFLNEHYSNHESQSNPDHQHHNLPFKTADCTNVQIVAAYVNHVQHSISELNIFQEKSFSVFNDMVYSSAIVSNIWQPPKIS